MIKPDLEFVYEATGDLEPPVPIGTTYDGTRRIIPIVGGGRETVPMHAICQNTLITNFTNSELQRAGMDVEVLLANPAVRKFVDWVANKDPDFNASIAKKGR